MHPGLGKSPLDFSGCVFESTSFWLRARLPEKGSRAAAEHSEKIKQNHKGRWPCRVLRLRGAKLFTPTASGPLRDNVCVYTALWPELLAVPGTC